LILDLEASRELLMRVKIKAIILAAALLAVAFFFDVTAATLRRAGTPQKKLDPAAWGSNHAGKPVPDYVHGDECLFCHRNDIGPGWQKNAHGVTVRQREDAPELQALVKSQPQLSTAAPQVEYFLGSRHRVRLLKKEGYGKFALLGAQMALDAGGRVQKVIDAEKLTWDKERFANRCAGCHTTGVEAATKTFSAFGLDCYACHGVVDLNHTNDTSLIFLSKKRRSDSRAITSTCAQCHIRTGKSRSTGLPYPNNFVAGDNLFQDYEVDFSKADDESLNAGDRHVLQNVRDVVVNGIEFPTCITCHDLHKQSSLKHRRAPRTALCASCHNAEGPLKGVKPYEVHSALCEY
jgi:predicted CXXCH cytochrome family protein